MNIYVWLAVLVVMILVEALTVNMVSVWFAGGALAALICALLKGSLPLQIGVFIVVSGVLLAVFYPKAKKLKKQSVPTNADRILNMEAVVTERIDDLAGTGAIRVDGKEWSARTENNLILEKNSLVRVLRIEGVKAIVAPADPK